MKTLLKQSLIIITALILTTVIACKKDDKKPEDTTQTDDQLRTELLTTENDTKAYGVYTGTLIGSSGYFEIFLKKIGSKVTVMFDGEKYELKSELEINPDADVINYVFQNDKIKLTLNVKKDGTNPVLTVEKEGHIIIVIIHKVYTYYNIHNFVGTVSSSGDCPTDGNGTIMISGGVTSGKFRFRNNRGEAGSADISSMTINETNLILDLTNVVNIDGTSGANTTITFTKTGANTYYFHQSSECQDNWNITKVN